MVLKVSYCCGFSISLSSSVSFYLLYVDALLCAIQGCCVFLVNTLLYIVSFSPGNSLCSSVYSVTVLLEPLEFSFDWCFCMKQVFLSFYFSLLFNRMTFPLGLAKSEWLLGKFSYEFWIFFVQNYKNAILFTMTSFLAEFSVLVFCFLWEFSLPC